MTFYEHITMNEVAGLSLAHLLQEVGMTESSSYHLTAVDGYTVEIAASNMATGVVYFDDQNRICTYFSGLLRNASVFDLYSIKSVHQ